MAYVPHRCPKCGNKKMWNHADNSRKGFSIIKATLGAILFWPVGLLAGFLGKKRKFYICRNCGYHHWY